MILVLLKYQNNITTKPLNQNKMKTQEQKEIKAEILVDDFVKEWTVKNNTEDAVYSAYHYDAMIAFAEYFNELNKSK
jgi:hypothetical protein